MKEKLQKKKMKKRFNRFNQKENIKEIALRRIKQLFEEASREPKYADRYVELARKISTRNKVSIPREFSRLYCRKCNSYIAGKKSTTRIRKKMIIVRCLKCNNIRRYKIKK